MAQVLTSCHPYRGHGLPEPTLSSVFIFRRTIRGAEQKTRSTTSAMERSGSLVEAATSLGIGSQTGDNKSPTSNLGFLKNLSNDKKQPKGMRLLTAVDVGSLD